MSIAESGAWLPRLETNHYDVDQLKSGGFYL